MTRIGITGFMGVGKSFIASLFKARGIPVYNTDLEIRRLQNENEGLKSEIIALLGPEAYLGGVLDRKYVAQIVFSDENKRRALMNLVGPYLLEDIEAFYVKHADKDFVLLESAILFETSLVNFVDKVIFVRADESVRIQRAIVRDGITEEQYRRRMANLIPEEDKLKRADYVIDNNTDDIPWKAIEHVIVDNKTKKLNKNTA